MWPYEEFQCLFEIIYLEGFPAWTDLCSAIIKSRRLEKIISRQKVDEK